MSDTPDLLIEESLDEVVRLIEEDDELAHSGVKGMKWGVRKAEGPSRKDQIHQGSPGAIRTEVTTKFGEKITVVKEPPGSLSVAVGRLVGRKPEDSLSAMAIHDSTGKKVGSFQVWKDDEHPKTVRGEWLEVNKSAQGKGYSKAAIGGLLKAARQDPNVDEVRLQVPADAGPAKNIYSQLGFAKDRDLGVSPFGNYGMIEDWKADVRSGGVMKHHDYLGNRKVDEDDKLDSGVKGMKWGVRKADTSTGSKSGVKSEMTIAKPKKPPANESGPQRYERLKSEAKAGRASQLSDDDLRYFNARTEALSKIEKLNKKDPDWLRKTSQNVLQEVAKETMKAVVAGAAKGYISGPIVGAITKK